MKAFIYPNLEKAHSLECTNEVIKILSSLDCSIVMQPQLSGIINCSGAQFADVHEGVGCSDVVITIGGDGTILKIASEAARAGKKLLGINCGRLGFMASLERSELTELSKLVLGDYKTESRMMLDITIDRTSGAGDIICATALNDIVITHGFKYNINDFTVLADGVKVSSLRADGLIFSTPTGASAYSLSAGGPLIEPSMDCIEFTQICPHSLFARTMIFSPEKNIEVKFKAVGEIGISADGNKVIPVSAKDKICIRRSGLRLDLIDISKNNYFRSIGSKLMQSAKEN